MIYIDITADDVDITRDDPCKCGWLWQWAAIVTRLRWQGERDRHKSVTSTRRQHRSNYLAVALHLLLRLFHFHRITHSAYYLSRSSWDATRGVWYITRLHNYTRKVCSVTITAQHISWRSVVNGSGQCSNWLCVMSVIVCFSRSTGSRRQSLK